jgi:hypothetical protein
MSEPGDRTVLAELHAEAYLEPAQRPLIAGSKQATTALFATTQMHGKMPLMSDLLTKPRPRQRSQLERPRLYKVILLNNDFTPREFVVTVLKAVYLPRARRSQP